MKKFPLEEIQPVAIELWEKLKPHCKKIKIGGSIRRQRPECKDIEIVLLPIDRAARTNIGLIFLEEGTILKGTFGKRYVKARYRQYPVDIFIPQEHDYYRQLAIRTGSANYAKKIAKAWVDKGYFGCERGLIEKSLHSDFSSPKTWDSEKQFFEWLGMKYLKPTQRM